MTRFPSAGSGIMARMESSSLDARRYPRLEGAAKERVLRSVRAALGPLMVKDHDRTPPISELPVDGRPDDQGGER